MQDVLQRAAQVRLVIFDVDGVLTDGRIYIDPDGREFKSFHSRDGHGMKMLQQTGVELAIISGRECNSVTQRMAGLGIAHVYQGKRDKLPSFRAILEQLALEPQQVCYVGDDVVDLPVMRRVGFAVAVQDAHPLVKRHAHWITASPGGMGAARDICELIIEAQGGLDAMWEHYLTADTTR